jgi:hypothetical protein
MHRHLAAALAALLVVACGGTEDASQRVTLIEGQSAQGAGPAAVPAVAPDTTLPVVHVYKTPTCGCCTDWVHHMEANGFRTEVTDLADLTPVKAQYGVGRDLASCHTSVVGDYVIEGHVPADLVRKLLEEKPAVLGIAVPGMPLGSPGMEFGDRRERYHVYTFDRAGGRAIWATRN